MKNIIIAGVGGQGLVLATSIIAEAAFRSGLDVKTNDVVGLSQRGGKVSGSIRMGDKVYSPNIGPKEGDIILGMEPLEAYRFRDDLRDDGVIIMNTKKIYPTPVLLEKEVYPDQEIEELKNKYRLIELDGVEEAKEAGNIKAANTVLIGVLAKQLDIDLEVWEEVLRDFVPAKAVEDNIRAFHRGYKLG